MTLDLLAAARGLRESQANRLFHEQHLGSTDEELPDSFLRLGLAFPDGARVSNLADRRRLWRPDSKPEKPGQKSQD